ncbi:hypothetical protein TNCT_644291 [Trichonephila clavata]|uniref:Uncharacterized protein n=1 Tax=Trichonephila clavata TaxID=2740835 RepID=A0A8X6J5M5_TRICU|nr:hypothetical protein TNCT_644291 [Trichonephila clavata]
MVSLQNRANLSPSTKDYRGEEQFNEPSLIFEPHYGAVTKVDTQALEMVRSGGIVPNKNMTCLMRDTVFKRVRVNVEEWAEGVGCRLKQLVLDLRLLCEGDDPCPQVEEGVGCDDD